MIQQTYVSNKRVSNTEQNRTPPVAASVVSKSVTQAISHFGQLVIQPVILSNAMLVALLVGENTFNSVFNCLVPVGPFQVIVHFVSVKLQFVICYESMILTETYLERLRWNFFVNIVKQPLNIFAKKLHRICLTGF